MKRAALLALLLTGAALALEYRVDESGGPAGLAAAVAAAFDAWTGAEGAPAPPERTPDAPSLIRYGDASAFGPDLVTLSLTRDQSEDRGLTVLVNPEAGDLLQPALLHEAGLLLGLSPAETGAMSPALAPDAPGEPTDEDRAALAALENLAPEDINQDGVVDFYDLAALAADYRRTGVNLASDIDNDGVVDDQDLALLREAYVFGPPAETPPDSEEAVGEGPAEEELPAVPETGRPDEPAPPAGEADTEDTEEVGPDGPADGPEQPDGPDPAPSPPSDEEDPAAPDGGAAPEPPEGDTP